VKLIWLRMLHRMSKVIKKQQTTRIVTLIFIDKQEIMILTKCPDPNAKLHLNIKMTQLEEVTEGERYQNKKIMNE